jgi:8-oxo-dGTP pyrophosphatase MutT (NUDIX family)
LSILKGIAIPPGLAAMLNDGPPVEPRPSASVLVARAGRDGESDWEILMMRRPGGSEFAPGAYVFPGGSVHQEDAAFGDPLRAAAARELFEELGILLARRPDGRFARDAEARRVRSALEGGQGWVEALRSLALTPALDRLAFLARWITPLPLKRRFDTSFFVCKLPTAQTEHPDPGEVVDWLWTTPGRALAELEMVYATRGILEMLLGEPDAPRFIRKLRRRRPGPVVMPRITRSRDGVVPVREFYDPVTLEPVPARAPRQRQASRQRS